MKLLKLIKKIHKIDKNAAYYILTEAPKLKHFHKGAKQQKSVRLITLFYWSFTPQGATYWNDIDKKLDKLT